MLKQISELSKKAKVTLIVETKEENEMSVIVLLDVKDKDDKSINITPLLCTASIETIEQEVIQAIDLFTKQSVPILERVNFVVNSVKKAEAKVTKDSEKKSTTKKTTTKKKDEPTLFATTNAEAKVETKSEVSGTLTEKPLSVEEEKQQMIEESMAVPTVEEKEEVFPDDLPENPVIEMIATDFTYQQYLDNGWTDQMLVDNGKARWLTATEASAPAPPTLNL